MDLVNVKLADLKKTLLRFSEAKKIKIRSRGTEDQKHFPSFSNYVHKVETYLCIEITLVIIKRIQ